MTAISRARERRMIGFVACGVGNFSCKLTPRASGGRGKAELARRVPSTECSPPAVISRTVGRPSQIDMLSTIGGRLAFLAAALLFQSGPEIPPPRGLVNDFANVIQPAAAARMERIAQDVRDKSKGEMAIVTLPDLAGRAPVEVALRIGREWKVGSMAPIGEQSRNAGVVILLVPKETSTDGGHCFILTG